MTTARFHAESATSTTVKALAFGAVAAIAMSLGVAHAHAHAQEQRSLRAAVVTLEPVVISVKRQQLPTVYVTGRRTASDDRVQVALAE